MPTRFRRIDTLVCSYPQRRLTHVAGGGVAIIIDVGENLSSYLRYKYILLIIYLRRRSFYIRYVLAKSTST